MGEPLKCKKCGWLIGSSGICRSCGARSRTLGGVLVVLAKVVGGVIVFFVVLGGLVYVGSSLSTSTPAPIVQPVQHVITSANKWGCTDREYAGKLFGFVADQDKEAFMRGIAEGLATGRCTTFEVGEPVFLTDTAIMSGLVKVRRKGGASEYWTAMEAIN